MNALGDNNSVPQLRNNSSVSNDAVAAASAVATPNDSNLLETGASNSCFQTAKSGELSPYAQPLSKTKTQHRAVLLPNFRPRKDIPNFSFQRKTTTGPNVANASTQSMIMLTDSAASVVGSANIIRPKPIVEIVNRTHHHIIRHNNNNHNNGGRNDITHPCNKETSPLADESVVSNLSVDASSGNELDPKRNKKVVGIDLVYDLLDKSDKQFGKKHRKKYMVDALKHYTKTKLFHMVKIVSTSQEINSLERSDDIGNVVMNDWNITEERETWWLSHQKVVLDALSKQRSTCQSNVKSVVVGAIVMNEMPSLEDILEGRKGAMQDVVGSNNNNNKAYFFFCDKILECVAGKLEWKKEKYKKLLSKSCVTVSDEAFALLQLINGWDRYQEYAALAALQQDEVLPTTKFKSFKFTSGPKSNKLNRWAANGFERYNELYEFVAQDRMSEDGAKFEKAFLEYMRAKKNLESTGTKKRKSWDDDDYDSDVPNPKRIVAKAYNDLKHACK